MATLQVSPARAVTGTISVPGDKSISHRAVLLASLAKGDSRLCHFLESADCLATLQAVRDLGIAVSKEGQGQYTVHGRGLAAMRSPAHTLDLGNSGTGTRLLAGILAGQPVEATLTGDESLRRRPMSRVMEPLTQMGARIIAQPGNLAPLTIHGGNLQGIHYALPVASAQVKSAVLMAGLQARGRTVVEEPLATRDHTERMIRYLGGTIHVWEKSVTLEGPQELQGREIVIPGDLSSAAFLLAAALLLEDSDLTVTGLGLNPSRTGFLGLIQNMGARIVVQTHDKGGVEPVGSVRAQHSTLRAVSLTDPKIIPNLIDEIPMLAVLASHAQGVTEIRNAQELRVKETDRIQAIVENLRAQGTRVQEYPDGVKIYGGGKKFKGGKINSHRDHRIAMAFAIGALKSKRLTEISDAEFVDTSFPGFWDVLKDITR